ncbi:four helix bundle protein [Robertkochia aurantiaca]|uniref:four helix bundle protein n=1 Tax=Robertkochia aurantiaca TaxID=2873700 RepID=UPI001CCAABF2|nr:four helix bundle protein [Robertkochia sp. 3YJGBD-33]
MTHKDLDVWKRSMKLARMIYKETEMFPESEQYGLKSQLRRCSVSIPSNIAEGAGRKGNRELIRFLYIALGSLSELDTQVELAYDLSYLNSRNPLIDEITIIRKMTLNLIKALQ